MLITYKKNILLIGITEIQNNLIKRKLQKNNIEINRTETSQKNFIMQITTFKVKHYT